MTTATTKGQEKITALYCRLSVEDMKSADEKSNDSNSIKNQKQILQDWANAHGYYNTQFFVDDGTSGTSFDRSDFERMERMVEAGEIGTIIVKDLSRFGREHVEMGRLTQFVYPSLGVTFISIQENVNTTTGEGVEMMPFHNIFNEWYAAQTSKKIRQVWKSKAEHGKRISSTVPYGYVRDADDKEKWLIDEPAAEIVRHIFRLCLAGQGPSQIARQLEAEQVLVPSAYYESIGRKHSNTIPKNPYSWDTATIVHILQNRQYTGCAVNFISTTVSYKVHKTIYNPVEKQQVIPNMQEPIIDEETWLRVQQLRKNKRRNTVTGRKSLFSGLVYCADCGAKLHFCASKSLKRNQEFFRCSNYKDGRGECSIHFIRDVVLEQIVLEAVRGLADFVRCYEPVFLYLLAKNNDALRQAERKALRKAVEDGEKRMAELDRLIQQVFERNVLGNLDDARCKTLMASYDAEQKALSVTLSESRKALADTEQQATDLRLVLKTLREMTDVKMLTPTMVNTLIERIEINANKKKHSHNNVKVDIYFTAVGMIDIPTEQEITKLMAEIQKDPQKFRTIA